MAGSGVRLFVSGEIAYAADVNTYLMDQVISRFPNATARNNAFGNGIPVSQGGDGKPAISEGRFCYLDDINEVQYYDGAEWQSASQFTVGDGTITEAKLAPNSVTSDKIAPGTIIESDVAANSIDESKLTSSVAGDGLFGGDGAPLSINVDDSTIELDTDAIRVKDLGITTAKLDDGSVTSEKLDTDLSVDGSLSVGTEMSVGTNLIVEGTSFIAEIIEKVHFDGAVSGIEDIDMLTAGIHFFEASSSASCALNFIGDGISTFDELSNVGQSITGVILINSGSTDCRPTLIQIDGEEISDVKWFGGVSFPDGSGGDAIDSYTITIIKTTETPSYVVLASQSKFS
jgi:hypothetical protein